MADSIAHYRIGSKLGQGGMGEVFRATDTKLGREVAVKLIAPSLAQDEVRMASFVREARTLASLNHPNIAAIYGVEDQALVMELVEGPTLAERIKSGPIPLEDALAIARQIADGLSAAHEKGIVHRDLKPANIKITPDGTVKLLDFGLAKAAAAAAVVPDETATVALSMAASGMIVGTPGYMAPEQARGQPVDKRADIWSFGVVLYEMLTGATLFGGQTMTDIMAAVVREEPDLTRVPPAVRPVLRRCLEKDPKRRLRDIGDAMLLLDGASDPAASIEATPRGGARTWLPWAVAAALLVALAVVLATQLRETPVEAPLVRFRFSLPEGVTFTQTAPFAISPDGRHLAFPAVGDDGVARVWVQDFSEPEPRPLAEVQPNPLTLVWSPDSRQILYSHQDQVKRVDVSGGPSEVVVQLPAGPGPGALLGAAWFPDNTIVYGSNAGVMRVAASGGTPEALTKPETAAGEAHLVFGALPDGAFLYSKSGPPGTRAVYVGSRERTPDQQDATPLLKTDVGALFAPSSPGSDDGELFFMRDATLVAQRFDAGTHQLRGEPQTIATGVYTVTGPTLAVPYVTVSSQGTVVYRTGTISDLARQLTWYSRDGNALGNVGERGRYQQMKLSPDGSRLAASQTDIRGSNADIWITDLATQARTRLTFGPGADAQPAWSPDGQFIAWVEVRDRVPTIYRKRANGAGNDEMLYRFPQGSPGGIILSDWSSDGFLVIAHAGDIFALPVGPNSDATREPIPIVQTPAREFGPDLSPDSRWLVYISDESGRQELFAQPFAPRARGTGATPVAGKWMVSNSGTLGLARWRGDGRELFFTGADGMLMAVDVAASSSAFQAGPPRRLFQLPRPFVVQTLNPGTLADITHDGERVLLAMPSEESTRPELFVMLNRKPAQP